MMNNEKLTIKYTRYEHHNDLPKKYQTLFEEAIAASGNAYAPYSEFHVGAAILLQNGTIVKGSNQENAAYPSGLCAERAAVYWTGANYPGEPIEAIAVSAVKDGGAHRHPVTPCGACRQALLEYEIRQDEPIALLIESENGSFIELPSVESLLPFSFNRNDIE